MDTNTHIKGHVVGLFLKLSVWLIPTFLALGFIGLHLLSEAVVDRAEEKLTARVANLMARVSSGLETLAETNNAASALHGDTARKLLTGLVEDPAITCAKIVPLGGSAPILDGPEGVACHPSPGGRTTAHPVFYGEDATLSVNWKDDEVAAARAAKRWVSLIILSAGLALAVFANWLALRVIVGRPLHDLISRIEDARSDAEHNALHDPLTGLANRRRLDQQLDIALREAARSGEDVSILNLDLDGFKAINDTMGHAAGDQALCHMAGILNAVAGPGDTVARMGGDEFLLLLGQPSIQTRAIELSTRIVARLSEDILIDGEICNLGTSIGIATVGADAFDGESPIRGGTLFRDADIALYRAKATGRGRWIVCTDDMRAAIDSRKTLAAEIKAAVEKGEFVVHYQPVFDGGAKNIVRVEALVRWDHPRDGLLLPESFVDVARELNLVDRIDRLVLEQALRDLAVWDRTGTNIAQVSVNVSARRLNTPTLIEELRALKVAHGRLVFEVLETVYLEPKSRHLAWNLEALSDLGIEIEIDDFGSGQASIGSILAIQPARLKLAREIIGGDDVMGRNALIKAVIGLGRSLDIGLVAQGAETAEQVAALSEMGFDLIQGFALAEPMPAAKIIEFVSRHPSVETYQG